MSPQPQVFSEPGPLQAEIRKAQAAAQRVGLVPTMGALHEGHLSLVAESQKSCDRTVVTIFVNPTQFAPGEDFEKYPRTLEQDLDLLSRFENVWVFVPSVETMYPPGSSTVVTAPKIARPWEGEFRPSHFNGVATIVLKLFLAAPADAAYFGQKDFQQVRVVEEMVRDLGVPIEIVRCPIVREEDGLAMSSRNRYLSPQERETALGISRSLREAVQSVEGGLTAAAEIRERLIEAMTEAGVGAIDYIAIADPRTLESVQTITSEVVILIAVRVGSTRLIDNVLVAPPLTA